VSTMRLAVSSAIWALATAQLAIQDPIKDFCRRHQQQTCVIDSKFYIDGGLAYYGASINSNSQPERNPWLLWGDLKQLGPGVPPLYSNLTKGRDIPTVSGGVLWPDQANKLFYLFGGEYNNGSSPGSTDLWYYDTLYNKWERTLPDGSQSLISWPAFGASTVTDEGVAYYYGGYLSNKTVSGWIGKSLMLNGLVSYDMNNKVWSNRTGSAGMPRAEGTLQYISAGDRGMLVYFGGVETSSAGIMSYQIQIYDIANSRWYTQTATGGTGPGDIPRARRGFCSGLVWAKDRSSYNIYIYGGIAEDGTAVGDVYILSLPSFRWIPYWEAENKIWRGGKAWASCNVINKSQMIVMSGFYTNSTRPECDAPTAGGQHSLLLGQESIEKGSVWRNLIPEVVEYRVPVNLTAIIGGGTDGKATVTVPAAGWATRDVSDAFQRTYSAASRQATRSVPGNSPTSSSAPSKDSEINGGAIAGGVVGGVVLLAIVVLAFVCLRRRKRAAQKNSNSQPNVAADGHTPMVENRSVGNFSMSQGSTMYSPNLQASAYSPQGSPRPHSEFHNSAYHESPAHHQHSSSWDQTKGLGFSPVHGNQQTYYPPPQDSSHTSRSAHTMSVELPTSQTPAHPAELPEVRSPIPRRGL
ncbi:hypothetical protein GQ44DRAFT_603735, partial [Phaeosphaeriaceae sp. PMI808]